MDRTMRIRQTREDAGERGHLYVPLPPVKPMDRWGEHWKCDCGFVNETDPNDHYPQCGFCGSIADEVAI
jgi:hypothetical protein